MLSLYRVFVGLGLSFYRERLKGLREPETLLLDFRIS